MFSFILVFLYALSLLFCVIHHDPGAVSALMTGADDAVKFCLSVAGGLCFWTAVTELLEQCGVAEGISKILHPLIKKLFPSGSSHKEIRDAISENISANLMGLGNAATPAGIKAARSLAALGNSREVSDELCMLVVLNTASIQLLPTSAAALRSAAGAASPFDILPAVWAVSALSLCAGLTAAFVLKSLWS